MSLFEIATSSSFVNVQRNSLASMANLEDRFLDGRNGNILPLSSTG